MTKLSFQLPLGVPDVSDESRKNAMFAMVGVVAIVAIISLVFLFQHVMIVPNFGVGFVTINANEKWCNFPGELVVTDNFLVDNLRENLNYKCSHAPDQDAWCCVKPR